MKVRVLVVLTMVSLIASAPAMAAPVLPEIRPRVGVGIEPDQFVFGAQAMLRARLGGLARLAPSLDIGVGDDVTATLINLDLLSKTLDVGEHVGLYGGVGIAWAFYSFDGGSDNEFGPNLVGGVEFANRFYGEARFGLVDELPDARLLVGMRFIQK